MPSVEQIERRIGQAVLAGIPKVHARLVADLDLDAEMREPRVQRADHGVLRLP